MHINHEFTFFKNNKFQEIAKKIEIECIKKRLKNKTG